MSDELTQDPVTTVREFLSALELGAIDEALGLLDPEIVWKNTGAPDVRGIRRVERIVRGFERDSTGFAVDIHHIAAAGADVVLTDRTDYLRVGPVRSAFWVTGTFTLRDGRILVWQDRFGLGNFLGATVAGAFRAVTGRADTSRL